MTDEIFLKLLQYYIYMTRQYYLTMIAFTLKKKKIGKRIILTTTIAAIHDYGQGCRTLSNPNVVKK